MITIDYTKITKEQYEYLMHTKDYVPLALYPLLDNNYFTRATEKAKREHYNARTTLQCTSDKAQYMEDELMQWLKTHTMFNSIVIAY